MTRERVRLGISGENLACAALRRRGYEIVARRHRSRLGEIDIIARDGRTLVFVEVKARSGSDYGSGADAVTVWKQRHILRVAEEYLASRGLSDTPCRFDVVVVQWEGEGRATVEVIRSAFDVA
ncbi:MAG TPA: YraN family protein [Vicinamibacterales bacterium]|nr:YraN family protein [Vicinamibacterales bacterium]